MLHRVQGHGTPAVPRLALHSPQHSQAPLPGGQRTEAGERPAQTQLSYKPTPLALRGPGCPHLTRKPVNDPSC